MSAQTRHLDPEMNQQPGDVSDQSTGGSSVLIFPATRAVSWVRENTFIPARSRENRWIRLTGYILAVIVPALIAALDLVLVRMVPEVSLLGLLEIMSVALIALAWGAGPALLATITGGILLNVAIIPAVDLYVSRTHALVADLVLYALTGITISIAVSRKERMRREAQAARASTQRFVSVVSHELRQPLTSLMMALQLSQKRMARLEAAEEYLPAESARALRQIESLLETSERQTTLINRLIGDLLDVSRIQSNRFTMHPEPVDMRTIARDAVEQCRLAHPGREVTLSLADQPEPVMVDAQRIGQVLTNYLTNAVKYSPADRPVRVEMTSDRGQVRVTVRDKGPGLPPEELRRIWEGFHRVEGIEAQEGDTSPSLGLGLHISKLIVEQHHGRVGVSSSPGNGSSFWFSLPLLSEQRSGIPVLARMRGLKS